MNTIDQLMTALGRTSYQGGVMILAVLAVQKLLGSRLGARWRYLLWVLVVVRLLLPVSFSCSWSLFNFLPEPQKVSSDTVALFAPGDETMSVSMPRRNPSVETLTAASPEPVPQPINSSPKNLTEENLVRPSDLNPTPPSVGEEEHSLSTQRWNWNVWLLFSWGLGVSWVVASIVFPWLRFRSRLRDAKCVEDRALTNLLQDCQRQMRVKRGPELRETDWVCGPALFGLWRPLLLLPRGFSSSFSSQEMRHVFLHELAHLKRRDLWMNWLLHATWAIHWFNPLVWLALKRIRIDRELACDAHALMYVRECEANSYGETLLRVLELVARQRTVPGLVGIGEERMGLRLRIEQIARFRKPSRWSRFAMVLVLALGVVGLTDAKRLVDPTVESLLNPEATTLGASPPAPAVKPGSGMVIASTAASGSPQVRLTNSTPRWFLMQVVDGESKKPVAGAQILGSSMLGPDGQIYRLKGATDDLGRARMEIGEWTKPLSSLYILIDHPGFAVTRASLNLSTSHDEPPSTPDLVVSLFQGSTIGGKVVNEGGGALAGREVRVFVSGLSWSAEGHLPPSTRSLVPWNWTPYLVTQTDSNGRWSFANLPVDTNTGFELEVRDHEGALRRFYGSGRQFWLWRRDVVSLPTLFAGTAVLPWKEGRDIRIRVTDPTGSPIRGAMIREHSFNQLLTDTFLPRSEVDLAPLATTDRSGEAVIKNQLGREKYLIVSGHGFATVTQLVPLTNSAGGAPFEVTLPRIPSRRFRFVNEDGTAIVGAHVYTPYGGNDTPSVIPFGGRTDERGEVEWKGAPTNGMLLAVQLPTKEGQEVMTESGVESQTIVIRRGAAPVSRVWSGVVTDAQTGQPIPDAVLFGIPGSELSPFVGPVLLPNRLEAGAHRVEINSMVPSPGNGVPVGGGAWREFHLLAVAPGYEETLGPVLGFSSQTTSFKMALQRAARFQMLRIMTPKGTAAAGARLCWVDPGTAMQIPEFEKLASFRFSGNTRDANAAGEVKLPLGVSIQRLLVVHDAGVALTSLGDVQKAGEVRLEPWAALELEHWTPTNSSERADVSLRSLHGGRVGDLWVDRLQTTDKHGRAKFSNLPPGDYLVQCAGHWASTRHQEQGSYPVMLKGGSVTHLSIGNRGMRVVGKCLPAPTQNTQNGAIDEVRALLVRKQPPLERLAVDDFGNAARWRSALSVWMETEAVSKHRQEEQAYPIRTSFDGSFRLEHVDPGIYEIRVGVPPWGFRRAFPPMFASQVGETVGEVVIPDVPFDPVRPPLELGKILRNVGSYFPYQSRPLSLKGRTLDGDFFSLEGHRGKFTLLTFWSSWSDRSLLEARSVRKLCAGLTEQKRFQMVGVSIDREISDARQAASRGLLGGIQIILDDAQRVAFMDQLHLDDLPRSVLLDAGGRVVVDDLSAVDAPQTLERLLKAK